MSHTDHPFKSPVWLDPYDTQAGFPSPDSALDDPAGLLAIGGDLSSKRLLNAYRNGIFPWYEEGQPVLWWSPDPRAVIFTNKLKISRSLKKTLRNKPFKVTLDRDFEAVITACAGSRKKSFDTWITPQMHDSFITLHKEGFAHSVEVWNEDDELVGGLYGVLLNRVFSGESMFTRKRDMSKVALVYLAEWLNAQQIRIIDCQIPNPHLTSMGAELIPRKKFLELLTP